MTKKLSDYLSNSFLAPSSKGSVMKPLKKYTQVDLDESVDLYDSRKDRWSRRAKRHFSKAEIAAIVSESTVEFEIDEVVLYENQEVQIRIPNGPGHTAGIMLEGSLKMVSKDALTKLDEMVMGMTTLEPIARMMQLAGIESKEAVNEDFDQKQQSIYGKLNAAIEGVSFSHEPRGAVTLTLTMEEALYLKNKIAP